MCSIPNITIFVVHYEILYVFIVSTYCINPSGVFEHVKDISCICYSTRISLSILIANLEWMQVGIHIFPHTVSAAKYYKCLPST